MKIGIADTTFANIDMAEFAIIIIKNNSKNEITMFCMKKGTDISEHTTTRNATLFVVEGDGVFNLEGREIRMKPHTLITMKKNAVHSLKAVEDTCFVLTQFQ